MPLVLERILTKDSCGVDVGCHIGSFLSSLIKYAPDGRHAAFEPSAAKSEMLKRRFRAAKIYQCAVSDVAGAAVFQEDCLRPGYSRLEGAVKSSAAGTTSYVVTTSRLDDLFLETDRLDLIKLDIEGGELAALRGAVQVINRFRPKMLFECGSEYSLKESMIDRQELYNFVTRDLNYDIFTYTDFLFDKGPLGFDEFRKCGLYPFRAFNFIALPR